MKSKVLSFLSGILLTLILIGIPVTAMAASNGFTIECYPIKVLVNGGNPLVQQRSPAEQNSLRLKPRA